LRSTFAFIFRFIDFFRFDFQNPATLSHQASMRPALIPLAAALLAASLAGAAPLGKLNRFEALPAHQASEDGARTQFELHTEGRGRLRISLLRADTLRIQASSAGALQPPGNGQAPIVLPQERAEVPHRIEEDAQQVWIHTERLSLRIQRQPLRLALYRAGEAEPLWQELQPLDLGKNLSVQTLSSRRDEQFFGGGQQNGRFAFKGRQLDISYSGGWEDGDRPSPAPWLLSSRGWGTLRHTWAPGSYDLRADERISLQHQEGRFDAYFFVGRDFRAALDAYTDLSGRAPMPPRWAFEYGDADCYNDADNAKKPGTVPKGWSDGPTGSTPDVVDSVARPYREHDMPGGWILPNDGYGCGYKALPETVKRLAELGFRTGLWTEDGVDKIAWEVGQAGSRAQKLDVAWTGKGYQHALDANHAAFKGILDNSDARPFLWTVMGWAGVQRYAVTWTGDQSGSWDYIRWHIPTLIGSGLSGQAYATGDVDGIFGGSPETFTRDLQWKAFTPVLMGMSGWSEATRKHPWWFDEPYRSINRQYLKLKLRLTPLMVSLAREAERSGAPLVRGLMWDFPNDPKAFSEAAKHQFLLGRELLVAPVFRSQAASGGWRRDIHLPQGLWFDYWDGRSINAPAQGQGLDLQVSLDKLPVFVRGGAILPMQPEMLFEGHKPRDELLLDLYPQGDSQTTQTTIYEDDGLTRRYREGEFAEQQIRMLAGARISVDLAPVQGRYAGQLEQRRTALRVLTQAPVAGVSLDGQALPRLEQAGFAAGQIGWFYDATERHGTLQVRAASASIRQAQRFEIELSAAPQRHSDFPAAPALGRSLAADSLVVVNRPTEEPGHPLEHALDDKPETWFRTTRNQAVQTGPHEWTLSFGERKVIDGIELAPRTDKHWQHGQVRAYEVFLGDSNGDWGEPVARGELKLLQEAQTISFPARAGRMLRFRVLSTHRPGEKDEAGAERALNSQLPQAVGALTLSRFKLLEQPAPERPALQQALSKLRWPQGVQLNRPASQAKEMRLNGLQFHHGLGLGAQGRADLQLAGTWQTFRADLGIDDSCRQHGSLRFQVWGDGRLIYDSGRLRAPAVVKPELDVRGLRKLSLRTLGAEHPSVCGNWANATLIGHEGDSVTPLKP